MNKSRIINGLFVIGLILYFIGRQWDNIYYSYWIGCGIMIFTAIWTLTHWKQNNKVSNFCAIALLLLITLSVLLTRNIL